MYEVFNPVTGVTLAWSRTMMGAWKKSKMFDEYGISNDWIQSPIVATRKELGWVD